MLYSVNDLADYEISATDGNIGKVRGFYFDTESFEIHYLVVDTGRWLPGRTVLISPVELGKPDIEEKLLPVNLSMEQIKNSPAIDEDAPITPSLEDLNAYYGWRTRATEQVGLTEASMFEEGEFVDEETELRSTHEITGFYVESEDGDIGHVEDFVVDDEDWMIRFMVIDTVNWLPGKKVLVSPDWLEEIGWDENKVFVQATREEVKNCPEYDASALPNRDYEEKLYKHFGKSFYQRPGRHQSSPEGYRDVPRP
jgi:hypothetical protein